MKKLLLAGILSLFVENSIAGTFTVYGDKSSSSQTTTTSPNGQTTTTQWDVNCTGNMAVVCAVLTTDDQPSTPKIGQQVRLEIYNSGNLMMSQTGVLEQYSIGNTSIHVSIGN